MSGPTTDLGTFSLPVAGSPALHYVDDYGSMEDESSADSSFQAFEDYNGCLQISMKPSKRQPPQTQHRIQGVLMSSDPDNLILTPCPARVKAMTQQIDKHLSMGSLTTEEARKMAGKCNFLRDGTLARLDAPPSKPCTPEHILSRTYSTSQHVHLCWHCEISYCIANP